MPQSIYNHKNSHVQHVQYALLCIMVAMILFASKQLSTLNYNNLCNIFMEVEQKINPSDYGTIHFQECYRNVGLMANPLGFSCGCINIDIAMENAIKLSNTQKMMSYKYCENMYFNK